MRRRRRVKPSGGVQMFSFLDAMICTMGALLVLLHAFARHGQIEIAHKAQARASQADLKAQREDVAWRIAHLKESRAKTEEELAGERLKLSHVEDHERRLRARLNELQIAVVELQRVDSKSARDRDQAASELEDARAKVRRAQEAVDDTRAKAQHSASAYSVVPYDGPNATRRRPIYIECRADRVVLQPEGVELAPGDFAGLMGPGNPLASALRAVREHLVGQSPPGSEAGEPYPLLLVRPEGIEAYYAARTALDTWGSEFGYELVGSDWKLKFPEPDLRLAELERQVVAEARERQREYVAAMAPLIRNRNRPTYHARSSGGFVQQGGSRGGRGDSGGSGWDTLGSDWSRRASSGAGGPNDGAGGAYADGGSDGGDSLDGQGRFANDRTDGGRSGAGSFTELGGDGGEPGKGEGRSGGSGSTESNAAGERGDRGGSNGSRFGQTAAGGERSGAGGSESGGSESGNSDAGGSASNSQRGSQGPWGSSRPGASGQTSGMAGSETAGTSGAAGGQASAGASCPPGGDSSPMSGGAQATQMRSAASSKKVNSMAGSRGRDWGLPDGGMAAIPATRPIKIECHDDRLVIVPEAASEAPREIRLGPRTQDSMDELVSNVWQHMKGWGVAGKGLYWRPTLLMDVKPGAADRYAEIKALLADSGLDVHERRVQPSAKAPAKRFMRK